MTHLESRGQTWIIKNDFDKIVKRNYQHIICPKCSTCIAHDWEGKLKAQLKYKYCPYCGTKMRQKYGTLKRRNP